MPLKSYWLLWVGLAMAFRLLTPHQPPASNADAATTQATSAPLSTPNDKSTSDTAFSLDARPSAKMTATLILGHVMFVSVHKGEARRSMTID